MNIASRKMMRSIKFWSSDQNHFLITDYSKLHPVLGCFGGRRIDDSVNIEWKGRIQCPALKNTSNL
jgi:hypothetical protein